MSSLEVLKNVYDNSEADVPAQKTARDISSKEVKKKTRNQHRANTSAAGSQLPGDVAALYSPNELADALYSESHFLEEPFPPAESPDDGANGEPSKALKPRKTRKSKKWSKKTPTEILQQMYGQFTTTCSTVMVVPRASSNNERKIWDIYAAESIDDEEAEQLQRLTSWNTIDTAGSTVITESASFATMELQATATQESGPAPEAKQQKKRTVKFDYPIISSLRECPRPDPQDLPNLYFTEEELGQIEDDRESTYTADDVEVVCVSTPNQDESRSMSNSSHDLSTGKTVSSKKDSEKRKRYIKSVQIYLRERSRDRVPTYQ